MDDDSSKVPFERIVDLLAQYGVEFIVIGGAS
jgi:hypothetical protein